MLTTAVLRRQSCGHSLRPTHASSMSRLHASSLLMRSSRRVRGSQVDGTHTARGRMGVLAAAGETQIYQVGDTPVEMPLGAVQQLPVATQAAVFFGIFAALGALTYGTCTYVCPLLDTVAHDWFSFTRSTAPLIGITYVLAGVAHFTAHDQFKSMMPKPGHWGIWYLPGSDSFHVNWTGVAEVLGGAGVMLGALPPVHDVAPWLQPAAAAGLFSLTLAVTPANINMFTHNAPGPGPAGAVIPPAGHAVRFMLQVFLLTVLWGMTESSA